MLNEGIIVPVDTSRKMSHRPPYLRHEVITLDPVQSLPIVSGNQIIIITTTITTGVVVIKSRCHRIESAMRVDIESVIQKEKVASRTSSNLLVVVIE